MKRKLREGSIIGTAFCSVCNETTSVVSIDYGIGSYEFWGHKSINHDWGAECSECGERIPMKDVTEVEDNRDYGDDL